MQPQLAAHLSASQLKPTVNEMTSGVRDRQFEQRRMAPSAGSSGSLPIPIFSGRCPKSSFLFGPNDQTVPMLENVPDHGSLSSAYSSPTMFHRKVERSRSEPKGPDDFTKMMQNKQGILAGTQQNILDRRYKTELCRSYVEGRECTYKDKCRYAHGEDELRRVSRHPKYRTEYCRPFHSSGICSYGHRCNFIHNPGDEPRHRISVSSLDERASSAPLRFGSCRNTASVPLRGVSLEACAGDLLEMYGEPVIGIQSGDTGSVSSGYTSYPSSPMSVSPSVDGMFPFFAAESDDCFRSNSDVEQFDTQDGNGEPGHWAVALNMLGFLD